MAGNTHEISQQNHNNPGLSSPPDSAVPVVNEQERFDLHEDIASDCELVEIPVLIAELERNLEDRVSDPFPLSVQLPGNGANPQSPLILETKDAPKGRALRTATLVSVLSIVFNPIQVSKNPIKYKLRAQEVHTPPAAEDTAQVNGNQSASLDLLNGWKMETRERSNGRTRDKFYYHPSSARIFRSLAEVRRFVEQNHNFEDTRHPWDQTAELQVPGSTTLPEVSSSNKRKRKRAALPGCSKSKRNKSSHVSEEYEVCTVKEFLAKAFRNLQNMSSPSHMEMKAVHKVVVEKFFAEAKKALLNQFENEETEDLLVSCKNSDTASPEMINEMIEELLDKQESSSLHEQNKDEQDTDRFTVSQGMTAFEMEVADIMGADLGTAVPSLG